MIPETLTLEQVEQLKQSISQSDFNPFGGNSMSFEDMVKDANKRKSAPIMNLIGKAKDKLNKEKTIDVLI